MVSYTIDDSILTLRASGETTMLHEHEPVFETLRADGDVPAGALVMLDVREVDVDINEYAVPERLRILFDQLGPKLGPVCAMLVRAGRIEQARLFQTRAIAFGLLVALFSDEQPAREWLKSCRYRWRQSVDRDRHL